MQRSILLVVIVLAGLLGCRKDAPTPEVAKTPGETAAPVPATASPVVEPPVASAPDQAGTDDAADLPRFAANSPFESASDRSQTAPPKRLWADSFLWEKAPELVVEEWLTPKPQMEGKYLLVECWATWCPPCRRSLPKLNAFHEKYKESLVVIGISEEEPPVVRQFMADNPLDFYVAADPKKRFKEALGVYGIPHAVIIEPEEGIVIWEGFPLQQGHELTEAVLDHILSVGRERGVLPAGS